MQALLFEVQPLDGHEDLYFRRAMALKPLLEDHPGMLFLDRFKSLSRPNVILSHQHWQDEAAIAKWRADGTHYQSQDAGRNKHFEDYRIRISHIMIQYHKGQDLIHWTDQGAYSEEARDKGRYVAIVYTEDAPLDSGDESFKSVNFDNHFLTVVSCDNYEAGEKLLSDFGGNETVTGAIFGFVTRDYSMYDRTEAPQFFPEKKKV